MWHKKNPDYPCLLVQFEDSDEHYFHNKKNWMPKEPEVVDIIKRLLEVKPSLASLFRKAIRDGLAETNNGKDEGFWEGLLRGE